MKLMVGDSVIDSHKVVTALKRCRDFVDRRRERDRGIDRDRERERDRDWDRGHESREWERERDRDKEREKRRPRSRSRSPVNDRHRRSASHDRTHKGPDDRRDNRRERERSRERGYGGDSDRGRDRIDRKAVERRDKGESFVGIDGQRAAIVAEFVDGIASEQKNDGSPSVPPLMVDNDEEIMKKLGIPTGFNTTKGKYISDTNHSAVKLTTKRVPRQYMNRRGGFNRPLPSEANR